MDITGGEAQQPPAVQHQQVLTVVVTLEVALVLAVVLPTVHLNGDPVIGKGDVDPKLSAWNRTPVLPQALFVREILSA